MEIKGLPIVGSTVSVSGAIFRQRDGSARQWVREEYSEPRRAVVTGYTHRCDGIYHSASGGGYSYDGEPLDYDGAYLAVTKKHLVVLVRFSAWGPEFNVLRSDIQLAPLDGWSLPSKRGAEAWATPEGERAKELLRAEMAAWPRDEKGRWLPARLTREMR